MLLAIENGTTIIGGWHLNIKRLFIRESIVRKQIAFVTPEGFNKSQIVYFASSSIYTD